MNDPVLPQVETQPWEEPVILYLGTERSRGVGGSGNDGGDIYTKS
jgi:hypothetical protein